MVLLTKAYRSCSTLALPVLAGVLPADLALVKAGRSLAEIEGRPKEEHSHVRRAVDTEVMVSWQERWEREEKGRELFRFFPDVGERMKAHWVEPDHATSQILTGHGCFRKRLKDMALNSTSECGCGAQDETRDHVLWECPLYADLRTEMLDAIVRQGAEGPVYHADLVSSAGNFGRLRKFARSWHQRRRLEEL